MVSLAPCSEMETEPCPGEQEKWVVETNEPGLKEAYTGPGDNDSQEEKELSHGPQQEDKEPHGEGDPRIDSQGGGKEGTTLNPLPISEMTETPCVEERKLKTPSFAKTVRFSETESVEDREKSEESLFPDHEMVQWTSSSFEELFLAEDWENITDDQLLRKKVLVPGPQQAEHPAWGQEVTVKMQGVLEDRTVVEKDPKLVFVIGEGDVNQALEECAIAMQQDEIALLLADSQYTYGLLGREPDIPAWAPLLYQLQLLDIREKPDPLILPISDRMRIGNQKRERGNFHFQREEYSMAARAYWMALEVLTTRTRDGRSDVLLEGEEEEVQDYRVKCLNNLAVAQLKLEQYDDALHTSRDVLSLDPQNVKALFRTGKLLSDKSEYQEAMEILKKALKLEPSTKAIHVELSKLVKRQSGGKDTQKWQAKPARLLGDNIAPFLTPSKKKPPGISWTFLLGALVVALGSLVTSVVLTARN
ncbi:peptidyl-prolyl cis-trans isomerase FKBP8-like isoform X1 [Coregonus clupeaformis]|uniref:peptidyl-prolyl cis-trans isomerase FKBP8-like isoform X1 n=1 Tax=Coregonus clupeaformis TaxID=59861 RepID=UPI001E1C57C9|nr:peptidyl-prolyl cis-trans isomerase FKBP8-like isoform X1 [Coregonus clupeaformis]